MLVFMHFVVCITFLLIKTRATPDRDDGLVEADTPTRAMKMENLLEGVKKKKEKKKERAKES